jgi:hypothetical protein
MSLSSRPKKVKKKGTVSELKLVQYISRNGSDTLKAEEVIKPRGDSEKTPSKNPRNPSSSPTKRPKLEDFDAEPVLFYDEGPDASKKRKTLVFVFSND